MTRCRILFVSLCCLVVLNARTLTSAAEKGEADSRGQHAGGAHVVTIRDFKFHPAEIEIQVGDSVTWVNKDNAPHTATRTDDPAFDTGLLRKDEERTIEFSEASSGSGFEYFCVPHPFMVGKVRVLLAGSELVTSHQGEGRREDATKALALPDAQVVEVHIKDTAPYFQPNPVEIRVGDSVKWINDGQAPHTATRRDPPAFNTGLLANGQSATVRFDSATSGAGIGYFCVPHPYMTGSVVVKLRGSHLIQEHAPGESTSREEK